MEKAVQLTIVNRDKGYSLVEVLVSILIMLIIMLGLIQTMTIYITHNIKISLRNEAIKIAQSCLDDLRNGKNCPGSLRKKVRNFEINFNINAPNFSSLPSGLNEVTIIVSYSYKGKDYSYNTTSVIKK